MDVHGFGRDAVRRCKRNSASTTSKSSQVHYRNDRYSIFGGPEGTIFRIWTQSRIGICIATSHAHGPVRRGESLRHNSMLVGRLIRGPPRSRLIVTPLAMSQEDICPSRSICRGMREADGEVVVAEAAAQVPFRIERMFYFSGASRRQARPARASAMLAIHDLRSAVPWTSLCEDGAVTEQRFRSIAAISRFWCRPAIWNTVDISAEDSVLAVLCDRDL